MVDYLAAVVTVKVTKDLACSIDQSCLPIRAAVVRHEWRHGPCLLYLCSTVTPIPADSKIGAEARVNKDARQNVDQANNRRPVNSLWLI